jgi:hypothetical protein
MKMSKIKTPARTAVNPKKTAIKIRRIPYRMIRKKIELMSKEKFFVLSAIPEKQKNKLWGIYLKSAVHSIKKVPAISYVVAANKLQNQRSKSFVTIAEEMNKTGMKISHGTVKNINDLVGIRSKEETLSHMKKGEKKKGGKREKTPTYITRQIDEMAEKGMMPYDIKRALKVRGIQINVKTVIKIANEFWEKEKQQRFRRTAT